MSTESNRQSAIPIGQARLYPHVRTDDDRRDLPIIPGSMDVTGLNVKVAPPLGVVSISTASHIDDADPYGIEFDLTSAAARALAERLRAAADACDGWSVDRTW